MFYILLGIPERDPAGYYAVRVIFTFVFGIASAISIFALKVLYTDSSRYTYLQCIPKYPPHDDDNDYY